MKKNDNVLVRPPDTFPTIYIQHGSLPVFSYQSKPSKNGAQGFEPNKVKNDIWMTRPIDAIPPVATAKLTVPPPPAPLARALPTPNRVFSDMEKKSKRETQTREDEAQEESIVDIPVAPACVHVDDDPPAPIVQALVSDVSAGLYSTSLEDTAQEESIAETPVAPACVHVDDDPPAPIVQALVSDVSAGLCSNSFSPPPPPESRHSSKESRIVRGLLEYKKWWFLREVGISVEGKMLTGTPIFMHEDTLRVVNDTYSYFIPMDNVDYIRTPDGLDAARMEFEESPFCEC